LNSVEENIFNNDDENLLNNEDTHFYEPDEENLYGDEKENLCKHKEENYFKKVSNENEDEEAGAFDDQMVLLSTQHLVKLKYLNEDNNSNSIRINTIKTTLSVSSSSSSPPMNWCKVLIVFLLVGVALSVLVDTLTTKHIETAFLFFLEWVQEHPTEGVLAVMIVHMCATVFLIPGWIMTIGAGYAFGSVYGIKLGVLLATIAIFCGSTVGSIFCFLLGRYTCSDSILRLSKRYTIFRAINQALEHHGLKINILLRLSIIIPVNILDYLMGVTTVSFGIYTISLVAILPGTIIYTFLGATASSLAEATSGSSTGETEEIILLLVGVIFAMIAICSASYYSKVELDKILAQEELLRQQQGGQGQYEKDNEGKCIILQSKEKGCFKPSTNEFV